MTLNTIWFRHHSEKRESPSVLWMSDHVDSRGWPVYLTRTHQTGLYIVCPDCNSHQISANFGDHDTDVACHCMRCNYAFTVRTV